MPAMGPPRPYRQCISGCRRCEFPAFGSSCSFQSTLPASFASSFFVRRLAGLSSSGSRRPTMASRLISGRRRLATPGPRPKQSAGPRKRAEPKTLLLVRRCGPSRRSPNQMNEPRQQRNPSSTAATMAMMRASRSANRKLSSAEVVLAASGGAFLGRKRFRPGSPPGQSDRRRHRASAAGFDEVSFSSSAITNSDAAPSGRAAGRICIAQGHALAGPRAARPVLDANSLRPFSKLKKEEKIPANASTVATSKFTSQS